MFLTVRLFITASVQSIELKKKFTQGKKKNRFFIFYYHVIAGHDRLSSPFIFLISPLLEIKYIYFNETPFGVDHRSMVKEWPVRQMINNNNILLLILWWKRGDHNQWYYQNNIQFSSVRWLWLHSRSVKKNWLILEFQIVITKRLSVETQVQLQHKKYNHFQSASQITNYNTREIYVLSFDVSMRTFGEILSRVFKFWVDGIFFFTLFLVNKSGIKLFCDPNKWN